VVKRSPVSCMPSPESPAKRMTASLRRTRAALRSGLGAARGGGAHALPSVSTRRGSGRSGWTARRVGCGVRPGSSPRSSRTVGPAGSARTRRTGPHAGTFVTTCVSRRPRAPRLRAAPPPWGTASRQVPAGRRPPPRACDERRRRAAHRPVERLHRDATLHARPRVDQPAASTPSAPRFATTPARSERRVDDRDAHAARAAARCAGDERVREAGVTHACERSSDARSANARATRRAAPRPPVRRSRRHRRRSPAPHPARPSRAAATAADRRREQRRAITGSPSVCAVSANSACLPEQLCARCERGAAASSGTFARGQVSASSARRPRAPARAAPHRGELVRARRGATPSRPRPPRA
jgi:hypothetical protein